MMAFEREVVVFDHEVVASEREVAASEREVAASEFEVAASECEVAAFECQVMALKFEAVASGREEVTVISSQGGLTPRSVFFCCTEALMQYHEARDMPFETDDLPTSVPVSMTPQVGLHFGFHPHRDSVIRVIPDS